MYLGMLKPFWIIFGMQILQVTHLLDLEHIVRDHNEELGLYVGGIVPCVLNSLIIVILYHRKHGRTWTSEITKNRGRLTPGLNNTLSHGYSHKSNAIYLEIGRAHV